ncbi:Cullin [Schizopora paradoxa]|uniref:Anaphase-promoting complex subunit 2 n=1 Tax=Schizopora paradoxa TaxID=27342 RepID=A0A0H2RRZ0_9AGAM|nr:Cullin [Schizopora paradoxa]
MATPLGERAFAEHVKSKLDATFQKINDGAPGVSGLAKFTKAWMYGREFLFPRDIRTQERKEFDQEAFKETFEILGKSKQLWRVIETFTQDLRRQLPLIDEEVLEFMRQYQETEDVTIIRRMIMRVAEWWKAWAPVPELGSPIMTAFNMEFQTHFFSILPPTFPSAFKALCASTLGQPADPEMWQTFETLGLLDRYENLVASVCYEQIEARVQETCVGEWSQPMLSQLRSWMADDIVQWMIMPYARAARNPEETRSMLHGVGSRFDFHVCKTLCDLRTTEIFDIIVDFPDSMPALIDLKECLQRVDQRSELVSTLRSLYDHLLIELLANRKRLLHPGADTKDILHQYVSMIRCLRVIDPPGVLLHKVADPVRRYLRERPDTIRSIVSSLVGEGGDLVDENEPIQPLHVQVEDYSDPNWEPEAIDAGPEFRTNKPSDVISTLVSIYDSKDLFVKELQVLLAQRLLAITDGNFDKERRNIEILKIRFGEAALQVCEVMLRDMTDSRRIDQHVQSQKPCLMHPTIISKHFWPPLQTGKLQMPGQYKEILETYSKEFTAFKQDKKLRYLPQLGTLDLTIELTDRTLDVHVPPLEAAVIELFSTKDEWILDDLSKELNVDSSAVRQALDTWVDYGVVSEDKLHHFVLLETSESGSAAGPSRPAAPRTDKSLKEFVGKPAVVENEAAPVMSAQQQEAEQMRVYWKFIEGMLTNLGTLPLDRIQTMLRFAPGYSRSIEQLGVFMEAARREGLVVNTNGLWKLSK